jgi:Leucine-rich repeat (LRR) protein
MQLASSCVPKEIGLCRSLKELRIVRNGAAPLVLPDELWTLDTLARLDLGSNLLARLPDGVMKLAGLEEISLFDCGLESLPESIGALPKLRVLNVVQNPKLKKLPKSATSNKSLTIYK